jgi:DNA-binding LytR/AlgR family response regulator
MTILIIEDEYPAAERLQKLLRQIDTSIEVVAVLESVSEGKTWFAQNPPVDLIFSDIQLGDGLSFQIFETHTTHSPIIFTTSYDEYAIRAFKVRSIDYLLKPIKVVDLEAAIAKFRAMKSNQPTPDITLKMEALLDTLAAGTGRRNKSRFLVKQGDQLIPVPQDDIAYFFTAQEITCLVRRDGKQFLVDYTLEELETLLNPTLFFRLNRQFIASMSAISRIHTYFNGKLKLDIVPDPGQDVLVSREKASVFKSWLET